MPDTPIAYDDVEVTRDSDLGLWVRVRDCELFVGRSVPLTGTTIRAPGDRGRLVVPRWFAESHDLPTS